MRAAGATWYLNRIEIISTLARSPHSSPHSRSVTSHTSAASQTTSPCAPARGRLAGTGKEHTEQRKSKYFRVV